MRWEPIAKLAADVQSGAIKATELVERALAACKDDQLNAVVAINESALEAAKKIDERIASGETVGRLAGIPFIAKDNFLTKGTETTAASNILKGFVPPYSATVISKLEDEGAILVAKANMDSFGHGGSTENSDFGPTQNPHSQDRVPGGSSGGSAAAVVSGLAPFALGTDTGGSNRLPASFTGSVGYKPTYGLVSRYGVVAMASSTDVVGVLAVRTEDVAIVLNVIAGRDERDGTTIDREDIYENQEVDWAETTIGVVKEYMGEGVDETVRSAVQQAVNRAKAAGATVKEVSLPSLGKALAVYYIVMPAEVSSNLSRYDGIRYGYSHPAATTLDDSYHMTRSSGFNDEVKRRIMIGTYALSSGYYDAYYKKAQSVRTLLINEINEAFKDVDVLVGPTAPVTAFKLGERANDPLAMYLIDIMTVAASLTGIPAISVPAGSADALPIGLQLMTPQRQDAKLLGLAAAFEALIGVQS